MKKLRSLPLLSLLLGCGCASAGLHQAPPWSVLPSQSSYADRQTHYDRLSVTQASAEGYVVDGKLYSDRAMKLYFRDLQSREAYRLARSAGGASIARTVSLAVPPPAGLVVGAFVGLLAAIGNAYSRNSSNNTVQMIPVGAGIGLAVATLGISLPLGITMSNRIERRRQEAAEAFNADLARRLYLQPPLPRTP